MNTLDRLVYKWLHELNIPAGKKYIKEKLFSHPDYPSLLSITDTLDDLGIENAALVVDKEKLHEIPTPFIAHTGTKGGEFLLVKDIHKILKKYPEFEKEWDGTIVAAEKPELCKNAVNDKFLAEEKRKKIFHLLAASVILLLAAFSLSNQFTWQSLGLLITSLGGLGIAVLIVQHELGISNEITEQLCGTGKNTDCDAVMKSKGSKFFKWFNWADAGIIYFSSVFLILIISFFFGTTPVPMSVLSLLAACSLPFTLFSVYYQWRVVRKWCPLCLAVVSVLWLQFLLLMSDILAISQKNITPFEISFAAFVFISVVILWMGLLKPALQKNKELTDRNFSLLRFKNNSDVFKTLLMQQRKVDITPFENDLQLGNPQAEMQIMVACSPYCSPCSKAHHVLYELVKKYDIGLTIRFAVNADVNEKKLHTVKYILRVTQSKKNTYKRKVLYDWYTLTNLEKFLEMYPIKNGDMGDIDLENFVKQSQTWTGESKIAHTPTIFINGYELPNQYQVEDLKNLIKSIQTRSDLTKITILENDYISV